jgi:hypothetical protein
VPEYDDYTLEDLVLGNNAHVARQRYMKNGSVQLEVDIYFSRDEQDHPLKCPYKIILTDYADQTTVTTT